MSSVTPSNAGAVTNLLSWLEICFACPEQVFFERASSLQMLPTGSFPDDQDSLIYFL